MYSDCTSWERQISIRCRSLLNIYLLCNKVTPASIFVYFLMDLLAWISSAGVRMVGEFHIRTPLWFCMIVTLNDASTLVMKMIAFWTDHILCMITLLKTYTNCMYTYSQGTINSSKVCCWVMMPKKEQIVPQISSSRVFAARSERQQTRSKTLSKRSFQIQF